MLPRPLAIVPATVPLEVIDDRRDENAVVVRIGGGGVKVKSSLVTSSGSLYISFGLLNRRCSRRSSRYMMPSAINSGTAMPTATPASAPVENPSVLFPLAALEGTAVANAVPTNCAI